jgi:pimeloyl-ACP methyl ester carboxylesterase
VLSRSSLHSRTARADASNKTIVSRTAENDGVKLHFLTAGRGPSLILLHGYAETSLVLKPIMPALAERFTVIAPDLPGVGDSAIPGDGLDMKTSAVRIHALARSLGTQKAEVVGHDIGLMVATPMPRSSPRRSRNWSSWTPSCLAFDGWEAVYNHPAIWHFRFNGPTPEALVQGRERIYFEHFWNNFAADKTRSIPEADRKAYAAANARPGRMRAGWAYFVFIPTGRQGFRPTLPNQADHAGPVDRRREVTGRCARTTNEIGGNECNCGSARRDGTFDPGRKSQGTTDALMKFL